MPEPLWSVAPVLTFQISTLNHFLSSLTCPLWPGAMTSGSLVSSSECNTVSLDVPFDCCDFEIRRGTFGGEGRVDVLDCSCFVSSGVRG